MKKIMSLIILLAVMSFVFCAKKDKGPTGELVFSANGEEFVAKGFTDKDGWKISFKKVLVNISDVKVKSKDNSKTVSLPGEHPVDFKSNASAYLKVGSVKKVKATEYRSLTWSIVAAKQGDYKGYSLVLIGTATKDKRSINFEIKLNEELMWNAKEGYSGDKIKGIVKPDKSGEVEMTFHFDHIFGDANSGADTHVNKGAVGFNYFLQFAKNSVLKVDQQTLKEKTKPEDYKKFIISVHGLGHSGEGHADVIKSTTKIK